MCVRGYEGSNSAGYSCMYMDMRVLIQLCVHGNGVLIQLDIAVCTWI